MQFCLLWHMSESWPRSLVLLACATAAVVFGGGTLEGGRQAESPVLKGVLRLGDGAALSPQHNLPLVIWLQGKGTWSEGIAGRIGELLRGKVGPVAN